MLALFFATWTVFLGILVGYLLTIACLQLASAMKKGCSSEEFSLDDCPGCPSSDDERIVLWFPCVLVAGIVAMGLALVLLFLGAGPMSFVAIIYLGTELFLAVYRAFTYAVCSSQRESGVERKLCCRVSQSSLNLNLNAVEPSDTDHEYHGPLPRQCWRLGRFALAWCTASWCLPPTLAVACALLPLGPLLPIPLLCDPRGRLKGRRIATIAALIAAIIIVIVWILVLRGRWHSGPHGGAIGIYDLGASLFGVHSGSSSTARALILAIGFLVLFTCLSVWFLTAPTTTCACCTPVWYCAYSIPVTILLGRRAATEDFCAFVPVPDFLLQAPLAICVAIGSGGCCDEICGSD